MRETAATTPDQAAISLDPAVHPAWLPAETFRAVGVRTVVVVGPDELVATVRAEVTRACTDHGGRVEHRTASWAEHRTADRSQQPSAGWGDNASPDLLLTLTSPDPHPAENRLSPKPLSPKPLSPEQPNLEPPSTTTNSPATNDAATNNKEPNSTEPLGAEGYLISRHEGTTTVVADTPNGLLYGLFHIIRWGEDAFGPDRPVEYHRPALARRMLDHWDNIDAHPVMGQVERGYAGGSLFWQDGEFTDQPERISQYARLLAAAGINALAVNNVNVHATEALLLTDRLAEVVEIADRMRPFGIRVHLSVTFAAPVVIGGLPTADPLDDAVRRWWASAAERVYAAIPDFGGFVVKADSEGQPGPAGYGRSHADGANLLADALAPHGGVVHWRAFVYNHRQDWRDRRTDRARAAFDHFAPLDGQFRDNAILQVKHGPIDFQTREPVSPVIAALPRTRLAVELQATQEYTGQQRHLCYLAPMWAQILHFPMSGATVAETARSGGLVAVSNAGSDPFWTGHPLAQANLYAVGRLAWDPDLDPAAILDEWIDLTFPGRGEPGQVHQLLHAMMDDSWQTYELYTAPLGVGFMVTPQVHYGPSVDGYEYSPWGTYHFADRDGVGVDRTRATGTGFTGQYPPPWSEIYESASSCPDELLLFFHHVPYQHLLHEGSTVVQHIYDTHFEGVRRVEEMLHRWAEPGVETLVGIWVHEVVSRLLQEQLRSAREWCDQVTTYFFRKSGVPDAHGRVIH